MTKEQQETEEHDIEPAEQDYFDDDCNCSDPDCPCSGIKKWSL